MSDDDDDWLGSRPASWVELAVLLLIIVVFGSGFILFLIDRGAIVGAR